MRQRNFHFVITGGSCSGKTSSLPILKERLTAEGYTVIVSPETGTDVYISGLTPDNLPWEVFQSIIVERTLIKEKTIRKALEYIRKPTVVLYDRGIFDNKVYLGNNEKFNEILGSFGVSEEELMRRYDAVFHMKTTAAQNDYTTENNEARFENAETALIYDEKVLQEWSAHRYLKIIGNFPAFEDKLDKLYQEIMFFISQTN